jgi:hypothetical protein
MVEHGRSLEKLRSTQTNGVKIMAILYKRDIMFTEEKNLKHHE